MPHSWHLDFFSSLKLKDFVQSLEQSTVPNCKLCLTPVVNLEQPNGPKTLAWFSCCTLETTMCSRHHKRLVKTQMPCLVDCTAVHAGFALASHGTLKDFCLKSMAFLNRMLDPHHWTKHSHWMCHTDRQSH